MARVPPVTSPWSTSACCCHSGGWFRASSGSPLHEQQIPPQAPAASESLQGHRAAPRGETWVVNRGWCMHSRTPSCSGRAGAGGCMACLLSSRWTVREGTQYASQGSLHTLACSLHLCLPASCFLDSSILHLHPNLNLRCCSQGTQWRFILNAKGSP